MSSAAAVSCSTVVLSATKARISTRSSTRCSALLMLSATRPNRPNANSEKAIVVTLSALSSGARRNAVDRRAKGGHQSTSTSMFGDVGRVEDDLAVIQLDGAEVGAAHQLEVVRRHQHGRAATN